MSFAPYPNHPDPAMQAADRPRVLGQFRDNEFNNMFEFAARAAGDWSDLPHRVFVTDTGEFRMAIVKKTVAHVAVDEAADGSPIFDIWAIKQRRDYS